MIIYAEAESTDPEKPKEKKKETTVSSLFFLI